MIQPQNIETAVEEFISLLKLNPEETINISKNDLGSFSFYYFNYFKH